MSTGPTIAADNSPREHGAPRRRLGDTKIRSKLALILVVPVAAVLALAGLRLVAVGHGANDAGLVRSLTSLSTDISALTEEVDDERMAAISYLANPEATPSAYQAQVQRTDERIAGYHARRGALKGLPPAVRDRLRAIDDRLGAPGAPGHDVIDRRQLPVTEAVRRYGDVEGDMVAYSDVLGQEFGSSRVASGLRAVAAYSRAKAATAVEQAVAFAALSGGQFDAQRYFSFVSAITRRDEALLDFSRNADAEQRATVDSTVTGGAVARATQIADDLTRSAGRHPATDAADASAAIGAVREQMRQAEIQLGERLVARAEQARSDAARQAVQESALVVITLILAIVLAVALSRSLDLSLRRLRGGALAIAYHDLPEAVRRLRDAASVDEGSVDEIVHQVRDPIRLTGRDEVGQVAEAFNVVHREAVRVAAEQAALRTSVSAMFLNLARRSQALVDRMIGELDMIERSEEDPKRLAQLFELDHLATRMRRNDENLLVLAGADSTPPRREDALLVDALRAAQSEVELYNRVEFGTIDTDISVTAHAVNDVVRLVAELLDNATRFSPPTTSVVASARRIRDHVVVQIEDRGLGLTDEQLDVLNRRLSAPPAVDVAAFRLMGLAVVSRLAARHGITVELRRNADGGTAAQVTLPASAVVLPAVRGREHVFGPPRQPLAVEAGPAGGSAAARPEPLAAVGGRSASVTVPDPRPGIIRPRWSTSLDAPVPAPDLAPTPDHLQPVGTTPAGDHVPAPDLAPGVDARGPRGDHQVTAAPAPTGRSAAFAEPTSGHSARPPLPKRVPGGGSAPSVADLPPGPVAGAEGSTAVPTWPGTAAQPTTATERPTPRWTTGSWSTAAVDPQPPAEPPVTPPAVPVTPVIPAAGPPQAAPEAPDLASRALAVPPAPAFAPPPAAPVAAPTPPPAVAPTPSPAVAPTLSPAVAPTLPPAVAPTLSSAVAPTPPPAPSPVAAPRPAGRGDRPDSRELPIFRQMEAVWFRSHGEDATQIFRMPPIEAARAAGADSTPPPAVRGTASVTRPPATSPDGVSDPLSPGPSAPSPDAPAAPPGVAPPAWPQQPPVPYAPAGAPDPAGTAPVSAVPSSAVPASAAPVSVGGADAAPGGDGSQAWRTAADEGWALATRAAEPAAAGTTRSGLPKRVPQAQLVPGGIEVKNRERTRRTPDEVRGLLSAYHRGVQRGRSAGTEPTGIPSAKETSE